MNLILLLFPRSRIRLVTATVVYLIAAFVPMNALCRAPRLASSIRRSALLRSASTDAPSIVSPLLSLQSSIENNQFRSLGMPDLVLKALSAQGITKPTPVQLAVIPRVAARENIVMAASTGSGKTLAYVLPAIHSMHEQEMSGYKRQPQRPRTLILVPTRDLARQVLQSVKQIGHFAKISSTSVLGGEQYGLQRKMLERTVDVVVASPGRLVKHKEQGNVFFSHVNLVIIDEVDTMLTQGFGGDIRSILRSVLQRKQRDRPAEAGRDDEEMPAQVVMATATLTKQVKALLSDVEGGFNIDRADPTITAGSPKSGVHIPVHIVEVDGLHRSLPHVKHNFQAVGNQDKMGILKDILRAQGPSIGRTLIFCNTVQSSRAVEYAINEDAQLHAVCYHGELNSIEREGNLDKYRSGEEKVLVCTDLAARGLDIPETEHVILFDFPLNPVDYLHRAGRCGRAGRKGKVTSLITKRDEVLSLAIQRAIQRNDPIDQLSSSKSDYRAKSGMRTRTRLLDTFRQPRPKKRELTNLQRRVVTKNQKLVQRRHAKRTQTEPAQKSPRGGRGDDSRAGDSASDSPARKRSGGGASSSHSAGGGGRGSSRGGGRESSSAGERRREMPERETERKERPRGSRGASAAKGEWTKIVVQSDRDRRKRDRVVEVVVVGKERGRAERRCASGSKGEGGLCVYRQAS